MCERSEGSGSPTGGARTRPSEARADVTANQTSGGPPLRALAMVLIALAIVFAGLGARELVKSDSDDSSAPATTTPAQTSLPTTTAVSTATVDKSTPVTIYNNGQIQGLAATVASRLEAEGWTIGEVTNYTESIIAENTVFYDAGDSSQRQVATALADELNAAVTEKSTATASLGDGVVVVVVTE